MINSFHHGYTFLFSSGLKIIISILQGRDENFHFQVPIVDKTCMYVGKCCIQGGKKSIQWEINFNHRSENAFKWDFITHSQMVDGYNSSICGHVYSKHKFNDNKYKILYFILESSLRKVKMYFLDTYYFRLEFPLNVW